MRILAKKQQLDYGKARLHDNSTEELVAEEEEKHSWEGVAARQRGCMESKYSMHVDTLVR